jgi:hypothetical protein
LRRRWGRVIDDGLDTVAVGINDECGEVVGAVFGAELGAAVVLAAIAERSLVELDYGFAIGGGEGEVGMGAV